MAVQQDPMPELAVDEEPFDDEILDAWLFEATDTADPALAPVVAYTSGPITFGLAEWTMRKMVAIDLNVKEIDEQYNEQVDRMNRWHATMLERLNRRRAFFESRLVAYATDYRAIDPKNNKTTRLPSGEISSTDRKPAPKIADDDQVVAWAVQMEAQLERPGELVRVKSSPVAIETHKLVEVAEVVTSVAVVAVMADGTRMDQGMIGPDEEPSVCEGDMLEVDDDIGGRRVAIAEIELAPVRELVVLEKGTMNRVPGYVVTPGELTFKVRPSL